MMYKEFTFKCCQFDLGLKMNAIVEQDKTLERHSTVKIMMY